MGHQNWQPQVFLDILVNSCLWYKCWLSESTLNKWWLWVALWKLTYGSQSMSTLPVNSGEARGLVAVILDDPY